MQFASGRRGASSRSSRPSSRPALTYSIVARDPSSGALGVAVQSHFFGVGSLVSWAEAGVGAVATQSVAEPAYGPRGLALMRDGKSAPEALHELLADDPQENAARWRWSTARARGGAQRPGCIAHAGHALGNQMSAQANIMARDTVPAAMVRAYAGPRRARERLLAALDAAEAEGATCAGASRRRCSWWRRAEAAAREGTLVDLRVDDHRDPLGSCAGCSGSRRLRARDAGDQLAAEGDAAGALREYAAAHAAEPDNPELAFWHGVALAAAARAGGDPDPARGVRGAPRLRRPARAPAGRRALPRRRAADRRLIGTRAESARLTPPACSTTGPAST